MKLKLDLTPKQGELLQAFNNRIIKEILFGGGGRGGKTWGNCEIINMSCIAWPGIAWLVGRREWDDLQKTTLLSLFKVFKEHGVREGIHYRMNMQTKVLQYYNGSKIFFVPLALMPRDPEFDFLGSYELTFAYIDEAQEVARKAIDVIKGRFTEKIREYDLIGKVLMGCNPMKGHLYNDFIKPAKEGTLDPERAFIQSLYKDNPHIDHKKYEENYKNSNHVTKQRILHGNWEYDDRPNKLYEYDRICDLFTNPINTGERYIIGDVAGEGKDRATVTVWNGFQVIDKRIFAKCTSEEYEGAVKEFAQKYGVPMSRTLIDMDGIGWAVVGHLKCIGFQNGSSPIDDRPAWEIKEQGNKPPFQNLKTQCYIKLQSIINLSLMNLAAMSEYRDEITQELDAVEEIDIDKDGVRKITPKEDIKEMIGRSPDFADTIAMRMYFELKQEETVGIHFI